MEACADNRVTLWNTSTKRKIAGKAAPMQKNLNDYLHKHPECELYSGQDKLLSPEEKKSLIAAQNRIAIWNTEKQKRISGNAAPTEKKLGEYLRKHPECEVYNGQDKAGYRPSAPVTVIQSDAPWSSNESRAGIPIKGRQALAPMGDDISGEYSERLGPSHSVGEPASFGRDSLEDMLLGMSIDENFNTFSGSGNLAGSLADFFGDLDAMPGEAVSVPVPMSPAQRIKRDRATSGQGNSLGNGNGGVGSWGAPGAQQSGSLNPAAHQRLRQGAGPGSLGPMSFGGTPTLTDSWGGM